MTLRLATTEDIEDIALLFDKYRQFYGQHSDISAAESYLTERMLRCECVIFIALMDNAYLGFAQLYPSFSSISMKPIWILNDLYVDEAYRKMGVATHLISTVIKYSRDTGRSKIVLSTAEDNFSAQALYKRTGFVRENFFEYEYAVI